MCCVYMCLLFVLLLFLCLLLLWGGSLKKCFCFAFVFCLGERVKKSDTFGEVPRKDTCPKRPLSHRNAHEIALQGLLQGLDIAHTPAGPASGLSAVARPYWIHQAGRWLAGENRFKTCCNKTCFIHLTAKMAPLGPNLWFGELKLMIPTFCHIEEMCFKQEVGFIYPLTSF